MEDCPLDLGDDEQIQLSGEKKANEDFERLCISTVAKTVGKVPITKVSSGYRKPSQQLIAIRTTDTPLRYLSAQEKYRDTIAQLIEVTDKAVQEHMQNNSHTEPASLAWAIAQRGNADTNIKASIE
jgi:hypothetical protein